LFNKGKAGCNAPVFQLVLKMIRQILESEEKLLEVSL
jgi:hypothetical protein